MNVRLLTAGTVLLSAALLHAQSDPKKAPDDTRQAAVDDATREAQRQGRVALAPNAQQSPSENLKQAIAFERYKEIAAEREARKESGAETRTATTSKRRR